MNGDVFPHWFQHQLLPNLESNSVIIMDNASSFNARRQNTDDEQPKIEDAVVAYIEKNRQR